MLNLNSENFLLLGTRTKTLGINIPGNVLVFFKMSSCPNCAAFEPIFVNLSHQENRVTHAVIDVGQYRDVAMTSKNTSTPITAVPCLILYIDGRPHSKIAGGKNVAAVRDFITKSLQAKPKAAQQQFMPSQNYGGANSAVKMQPGGGGKTNKSYLPELGMAPSMKGIIKGGRGGYAGGNNADDDDEPVLQIPEDIVPYNVPWYRDLGE
jgi:thiol-disulfide isomerase/thioredoxin